MDSNHRYREGDRQRLGSLICCIHGIFQVRLFRLNSAEILRRNSSRIGGFKERKFEADSAIKEVATQTRLSRANAIQFRTQKTNEPPKIGIVVQRDPLGVYEVVRQRLRCSGGPIAHRAAIGSR